MTALLRKTRPKSSGIGEDIFLEREKDAGGIDEIDGGDAIVNGDVLRANDLLGGHGEEGAGFDGGVVGNEHEHAAGNAAQAGDGACGGAPPHSWYIS